MLRDEIKCQKCQDEELLICPDCKGKSNHWCEKDKAAARHASRTGDNSQFCTEWDEPECDTCESTGSICCDCVE